MFVLDLCPSRAVSASERFSGDSVLYKPMGEGAPDLVYLGSLTNFDLTYTWAQDKCVPLVREITFENGEVCLPRFSVEYFIETIHVGTCSDKYARMYQVTPKSVLKGKSGVHLVVDPYTDSFRGRMCDFQELTEEGLPFLILFHLKEDSESLEKFQNEVTRQLISEKGRQHLEDVTSLDFNQSRLPVHKDGVCEMLCLRQDL